MTVRPFAGRAAWALRRTGHVLAEWLTGRRSTKEVVRSAMRVTRFDRWGVRPISQRRLLALVEAANARTAEPPSPPPPPPLPPPLPEIAILRGQLDVAHETIAHLRRVERLGREGIQRFVDELQHILLGRRGTTDPGTAAASVIAQGGAPADALATLVNLSEEAHGSLRFQYLVPFFAGTRPFPLPWPDGGRPLRVVDIGSQALASEADVYASLRQAAPVVTIGFDPFLDRPVDSEEPVTVRREDGGTIETYPYLIADGTPKVFHINRYDATSSILPANRPLLQPFGLLSLALEPVAERTLPTRRLDDVLRDTPPVDFLKIDVQGASQIVLANAAETLRRTLICHVEVEFAPVYSGQRLFADVDALLRDAGFGFVDFHSLGRQRYEVFTSTAERAFHRGRTLWADAVYLRGLDEPGILTPDELRRAAVMLHCCYNKQDLAAELLARADAASSGDAWLPRYLAGTERPAC